jgi:cobalt-zinc-cadmium efflux system protein
MSHDHGGVCAGARHQRALVITFTLVVVFLVVEAVAGFMANSLALLLDRPGDQRGDVRGRGVGGDHRPFSGPDRRLRGHVRRRLGLRI